MIIVTDTNILVRCSRGGAFKHVRALRQRDVALATTERNAAELVGVLQGTFGLSEREALAEAAQTLRPFEVLAAGDYEHAEGPSRGRLAMAGQPDWPALAAALAFDGAIWSDDKDYLGVGVPIWATRNISFIEGEA